jgi:hypothetical protein
MKFWRLIVAFVIGAVLTSGAGDELTVAQAAGRLEKLMPQIPSMVGALFRVLAAEALKERHPDPAAKFVHAALEQSATLPSLCWVQFSPETYWCPAAML